MRIATFFTAASVLLLSTIGLAQKITYDFDKSMDFASTRSYAWVRGAIVADELNHRRITNAVDAQLQARGLRKVDKSAGPDLLVAYHASFDRDLQIVGFSSGWGGYRLGGTRTGTARAEEILTGTLAVDIVDAGTKTIVWRALASKEIDVKAGPEKREKNINKAVEKIFANYPTARLRNR
jgi:hypothetical protein